MNKILLLLIVFLLIDGCTDKTGFDASLLEKPYINHDLPKMEPQIFAPGLVSSKHQEHSSLTISPDGKEIWWSQWQLPYNLDKYPQIIKYTKFENNKWSEPETAPFSGKFRDGSPAFSPDGNKIFFYSRRPLDKTSNEMKDNDIWYIEKKENSWCEPVNLDTNVNSPFVEATPCLAANGNLYFTSNRIQYEDPTGNSDIFVSEFIDGKFTKAKSLGDSINATYARDAFPYVAPDESYLIFNRDSRRFDKEGQLIEGDRRMMISFKNKNGHWGNAIDMDSIFKNTRFPYVTPDGKYFIYTKYTEGNNEDFYWVDAKIIEKLNKLEE